MANKNRRHGQVMRASLGRCLQRRGDGTVLRRRRSRRSMTSTCDFQECTQHCTAESSYFISKNRETVTRLAFRTCPGPGPGPGDRYTKKERNVYPTIAGQVSHQTWPEPWADRRCARHKRSDVRRDSSILAMPVMSTAAGLNCKARHRQNIE